MPSLPFTRREFLGAGTRGLGLLAFSQFAPSFLVRSTLAAAPAPERDRTILVLVQLAGGNDGLNTVVPFEDANYYGLRPSLAIPRESVLPLDDLCGLHPDATALHRLFQDGRLGIVRDVGYPNPNRSHFRSTEIWETASGSDEFNARGWLGGFLDHTCAGAPGLKAGDGPAAIHLSNEVPQSFLADHPHAIFGLSGGAGGRRGRRGRRGARDGQDLLERFATAPQPTTDEDPNASFLRHTTMNALVTERRVQAILADDRPAAKYSQHALAQSLRQVAALVAAGLPTRVYYATLGGFDTHANQAGTHARLLRVLGESLAAFQTDLQARRLDQQVLTMTFSEFGRRPGENQSGGTDHGTAAPLFVMGAGVRGGLYGDPPKLNLAPKEDLTFSTDFRQVYSTVLDRWLDCPSQTVLDQAYPHLDFLNGRPRPGAA